MSELCGCASVNVINLLGMECHDGIMGNGIMGARDQTMIMMRPMRCEQTHHNHGQPIIIMEHFFSSLIKTTPESLVRIHGISANLLYSNNTAVTTKFRPQVSDVKNFDRIWTFGPTF
jgi:hypothetical protein